MRKIEDLEHFVLQEGETLILRCTKNLSPEQLYQWRKQIEETLPGRPVMILPPEVEVMAGQLVVFGVDPGAGDDMSGPTQEEIESARTEIVEAYYGGKMIYCSTPGSRDWFFAHIHQSPVELPFDWDNTLYSLTAPKR